MAESATASCGPLFLCVTLYLAIIVLAVQGQDVIYPNNSNGINDSCVLTSGAKGICKLIQGCPVVEKTFKVKRPKICSFQGRIPIVCCPQGLRDSVIDISPPTTDFECGLPQPGPIQPVPLQPEPTRTVHLLPERRTRAIPPPTASLSVIPFPEVLIHHAMLGVPSAQNAWPWMALLHRQHTSGKLIGFCGGVLVNPHWVLTAAHCTNIFNVTMVRLGENDFTRNDDGIHEDVGVAEVLFYPGYQLHKAYHDISLIRLARTVNLRREVSPVCLPWGREADLPLEHNIVTITGWGPTEFYGDPLSTYLNEIDVTVFPTDVCVKSYSTVLDFAFDYPQSLGEESLCIGDDSANEILKDSCPGDSGGPAVHFHNGRYIMVGIVSKGYGCGKRDFPGIYVNMQYREHLAWIKRVAFSNN